MRILYLDLDTLRQFVPGRDNAQARVRSEVFTRSIGKELRKLSILSGGILVILVVLAFVL